LTWRADDYDNLPDPNVLAQEIGESLEAALEQFREITADFRHRTCLQNK